MPSPNPSIPEIASTPALQTVLSPLLSTPIALFPVRIETRFFPQPDNSSELRIRIYPDAAHIDSHEPELTSDELEFGHQFWNKTWKAASDLERAKTAWRQLADRFGDPRAAWIARVLEPSNQTARPSTPISNDATLPTAPQFPTPATRLDSWTRAPVARMLPQQWTALGYKANRLVFNAPGKAIPSSLAVGPNPASPQATPDDEKLAIDDGMAWMVDFDAAESAGMGIRVKLEAPDASAGFDFILVFGVQQASTSLDGAKRLAALIDTHHYSDGLAFLPFGASSNNTTTTPAGSSSKDPGHEQSYAAERAARPFTSADGSNAAHLATAFGLPDATAVLGNLVNATATEQLDARHMNAVLWPSTWGYFLAQMLGVGKDGENPLGDDDIAWTRNHFIDHVRAGGSLPSIRIGKQPYGLLPVTSLSAWTPTPQEPELARTSALHTLLLKFRDVWRRSTTNLPRLGRTDDLDADLTDVLKMEGLSSSYSIRNFLGRHYLEHLWVMLGAKALFEMPMSWQPQPRGPVTIGFYNQWFAEQEQLTQPLMTTLGVTTRPRLAKGVFAQATVALHGSLVQPATGSVLAPNYIDSLLAARDLDAIRTEQLDPKSLLHLLLRHSLLLEYGNSAALLLANRGLLTPVGRREPEIVDLPVGTLTLTAWRQLATSITVSGTPTTTDVASYLLGSSGDPDVAHEPGLQPLADFRTSLKYLRNLAVPKLEQLLCGTLDLASHRLDAWITSLAAKRLAELRSTQPTGILVGGYGWVMNVVPKAPLTAMAQPPANEPSPVYQAADNPGFIHTPSLAQATTAALLRSGHLAHATDANPGLLAIDLSSARVRLAKWLLDGVRQGQPLGALLGYRLERRLHDQGKPQFIAAFRSVAPLVANKLEQTTAPVEAIAANNVVDGLALNGKWQAVRTSPTALVALFASLPSPPSAADLGASQGVLVAELDALTDSIDAVSDALMAESVYQVVSGNPVRAATTVEAIAGGEAPPPDLDVADTPRSGIALTYRLMMLASTMPALPVGWSSNSARALAEPHGNAWVGRLLGDATRVRCRVVQVDSGGNILASNVLQLDKLLLAPLDALYAVDGQTGQLGELEQRILYAASSLFTASTGTSLRVDPSRDPAWSQDLVSFGEFSELLRTIREAVAGARPLDAVDLDLPDRNTTYSVDLTELVARATNAETTLHEARTALDLLLVTPTDLDAIRDQLFVAAGLGVIGAIPLADAALVTQATSVAQELASRIAKLTPPTATATTDERRSAAIARLRTIFGAGFQVMPLFQASNVAELTQACAASTSVQANDPLASATWFQRMARVRDGVGRLQSVLDYSDALANPETLNLAVAQLPFRVDDRWVALPPDATHPLSASRVSLVIQSSTPIRADGALAGLIFDEWTEVVPSKAQTTGIALQYDQPKTAPPQAILLAVPPDLTSPWTTFSLQQVLLETLDLARLRAVDPESLGEVSHYLPASYLVYNATGQAVSSDFAPLT